MPHRRRRPTALASVAALLLALPIVSANAQEQERPEPPPWAPQAPERVPAKLQPKPKVPLRWDRYYHIDEMLDAMREIAAAYPDLVELRSIGKSVEGRELLMAVVTDRTGGADTEKPAFWCDGNIHGNEVQAGEACLYMIWWLTENRASLPRVAKLLKERAFYVLPSLNPDGRAHWFDAPNTMHSSRGGKRPVDNDRDGLYDEDPPNDLDGDGEILRMRIEDPTGGWVVDPEEPRLMRRARPGERGRWRMLGEEGIDDDRDGRINEDGPGGYDPNRDWPSDWRGPAEQRGAGPYPLSLPESRAVAEFVVAHPNIAGFQSFHNTGGMILRGPGSKSGGPYPANDDRVMRAIAKRGEEQLPFYRSMVIWKDLYQVYGGEVNWAYEGLGIFAFTNELWSRDKYRGRKAPGGDARGRERLRFDDDVEFGARHVEWKPFDHPQFGAIELGGWRRETGRVPPPFMLQESLHRNMAFVLYHAGEMPLVRAGQATTRTVRPGVTEVTCEFLNDGMIPTRTQRAVDKSIGTPDRLVATAAAGGSVEIVSSGIVDRGSDHVRSPELERPAELRLPRGISGDGTLRLRLLVRGSGALVLRYVAEKGGTAELRVDVP